MSVSSYQAFDVNRNQPCLFCLISMLLAFSQSVLAQSEHLETDEIHNSASGCTKSCTAFFFCPNWTTPISSPDLNFYLCLLNEVNKGLLLHNSRNAIFTWSWPDSTDTPPQMVSCRSPCNTAKLSREVITMSYISFQLILSMTGLAQPVAVNNTSSLHRMLAETTPGDGTHTVLRCCPLKTSHK